MCLYEDKSRPFHKSGNPAPHLISVLTVGIAAVLSLAWPAQYLFTEYLDFLSARAHQGHTRQQVTNALRVLKFLMEKDARGNPEKVSIQNEGWVLLQDRTLFRGVAEHGRK